METRRIRRLARRRVRRTMLLAVSLALAGAAVGTRLPHDHTATMVLLVAATGALVFVAMRSESVAPLHGLHRVVRLPLGTSLGATVASHRARVAGSARALRARLRPHPTPFVVDEPDDESETWWGVPSPPETPVVTAPAPVVAAPLASAHVPAEPTD